MPELHVGGLPDRDARKLLMSALRAPLDEQVRERIVAEAGGNALAVLEVPRRVTPAQLAGGFGKPDAGTIAGRAEALVARQLASLPDESRRLVLLAAAEPLGEPLLLWRAADRLGIPSGAAGAPHAAGLLEIATRVRFRHPQVRAAIYRSASPRERCLVHGVLADATDARSDPERRAWHRAQAASAPDEDVAAELERSSRRAAARGGLAAEAAFLRQAATLTPDAAERARRGLASAEAARQAGDQDGALQILITAEAGPLDALGRARAELLRARVALSSGAVDAARRLLRGREAARAARHRSRARRVPGHARCDRPPRLRTRAAIRSRWPMPRSPHGAPGHREPTDLLLDGLALHLTKGYAAAAPKLRRALEAYDDSSGTGLGSAWLASYVAAALWQHDTHRAMAERHVRLARETGALGALPTALAQLASVHLRRGRVGGSGSTPA